MIAKKLSFDMGRLPAGIVRHAREVAGLSQRALARKAKTTQSVVARIELGQSSPTWHTLTSLLRATGHVLDPGIERVRVMDRTELDDVPRILRMKPEQRLEEVAAVSRFLAATRRV